MILAAEELGDLSGIAQGKQGLVGYLKWLGKVETRSFAAILGKLIPMCKLVLLHGQAAPTRTGTTRSKTHFSKRRAEVFQSAAAGAKRF
jgi:hypothetical protein